VTTNRLTDKECRSKLCPSGRMAKPKQTASTPRLTPPVIIQAFFQKNGPVAKPARAPIRSLQQSEVFDGQRQCVS